MSDMIILSAETRTDVGKGASRRLRREADLVPGILYGGDAEPTMLVFPHNKVTKALENEAFFSSVLKLSVDGKEEHAVLKDLQRHPSKAKILHMDFLRVSRTTQLTMSVPLHFLGEEDAPGVKAGGSVSHLMTQIDVKCAAQDLPEAIEVDLSKLELDHSVHLSEIVLPKGVEFSIGDIDAEHDLAIASIHMPRVQAEEEPETAEEAGATEEETPAAEEESKE